MPKSDNHLMGLVWLIHVSQIEAQCNMVGFVMDGHILYNHNVPLRCLLTKFNDLSYLNDECYAQFEVFL